MKINTIEDNNTNFELVELCDKGGVGYLTPHCKVHGAMNKVSVYDGGGMWRCLQGQCRAGCKEIQVKSENTLLEAIREAKKGNPTPLAEYIDEVYEEGKDILPEIENLLLLQLEAISTKVPLSYKASILNSNILDK